jgi:hypothetical protein
MLLRQRQLFLLVRWQPASHCQLMMHDVAVAAGQ